MRLFTVQLAKWRWVMNLGIPLLDTTVKSGNQTFAPTYEMVMDYKSGRITEDQYTKLYYERMRKSYIQNKMEWIQLWSSPTLAIACYCSTGNFCHRLLLVDMLRKIAESEGLPFIYEGELTK